MGVSGSGKSTVGAALARALGWPFLDADDFHPPQNVAKMAAGTPLTDDDRWPWLDRTVDALRTAIAAHGNAVLACSALRHAYRGAARARRCDAFRAFARRFRDDRATARDTPAPLHAGEPAGEPVRHARSARTTRSMSMFAQASTRRWRPSSQRLRPRKRTPMRRRPIVAPFASTSHDATPALSPGDRRRPSRARSAPVSGRGQHAGVSRVDDPAADGRGSRARGARRVSGAFVRVARPADGDGPAAGAGVARRRPRCARRSVGIDGDDVTAAGAARAR